MIRCACLLAALSLILAPASVNAQNTTYTWDILPGTVGVGNGSITGGSGTWDTASGNWTTDGLGTNNVAWINGSSSAAVFGGTAGTVTLGTGITANALTFNSTGYSITGSPTLVLAGTTPTITTLAGTSATISSLIDGTAGLTKATSGTFVYGNTLTGSSTLTLNGSVANTFTGGITINGGILNFDYSNLAGSTNIVNSANGLTFGGGIYSTVANATTNTSQTLAGLTVNSGAAVISLGASGSLTDTLTFTSSTITRASGGTAAFILPTNTTLALNPALVNGIVGPWAITSIGGGIAQYATTVSGNIAGLTGTAAATGAALSGITGGTANYDVAATGALTSAASINTLRNVNTTAAVTISGSALTLNGIMNSGNGGLLMFSSTAPLAIAPVTSGGNNELVIFGTAANTSSTTTTRNITIAGVISGASGAGVTYTGVNGTQANLNSVLTLTGSNTFTGQLTINSGSVAISTFGTVGTTSAQPAGENTIPIVLNGGTLRATGGSQNSSSSAGSGANISIGANGGTIDVQTGSYWFDSGSFYGSGNLNIISSNASTSSVFVLYTGTSSSTFTGNITIGDGIGASGPGFSGGLQVRSSNSNPLGNAIITVRVGGFLTADAGYTTPSSLSNTVIMQGGTIGQQGIGGSATGTAGYTYTGSIILQANSYIGDTAGSGDPVIITGPISGTAGFTKISNDVLILPNANTYSGGTTFTLGTVRINNAGALGSGPLTFNGGSIDNTSGAAIVLNGNPVQIWNGGFTYVGLSLTGTNPLSFGNGAITLATSTTSTISIPASTTFNFTNAISGSGNITKTGAGTLSLTGAFNETGTASITAGTLNLNPTNGSVLGALSVSGTTSTLNVANATGLTMGLITYSSGTLTLPTSPYTAGGFAISAATTITVPSGSTVNGPVTVSAGTLNLSAATLTAGLITYSGGTLTLPSAYTATGFTVSGGNPLSVPFSNFTTGNVTVSGSGNLSFTGTGNTLGTVTVSGGTLNLLGANTTTGAITLSGSGLLNLAASGNVGTQTLTLAGGNFKLLGQSGASTSSQTLGNLILNAGSSTIAVDPNNGAGTTLYLGNAWTVAAGATVLFDYSSANTGSRFVNTGSALTSGISNGIITNAFVKNSAGTTTFATQDANFNIVPLSSGSLTTLTTMSNSATTNFSTLNTVYVSGVLDWTNGNLLTNPAVNSLTIDTTNTGGTISLGTSTTNVLTLTSGTIVVNGANNETITGGQIGAAASALTIDHFGTGTLTIASLISSGAGSLVKNGTGTVVLTGANTYTGGTTVGSGMLSFGDGTTNGSSPVLVPATGTISVASGATVRFNYLSTTSANPAAPPWARITGAGTVDLKTNQLASGSFTDWGTLTLPTTFTGQVLVETGRIDTAGSSGQTSFGGATSIAIRAGSQLLAFNGTFPEALFLAGQTGAGESGEPEALRVAAGYTGIWSGPITLTANSGILTQTSNSNWSITGSITGNFELELYSNSTSSGLFTIAPAGGVQNSYGTTAINGPGIVTMGNAYALSTGTVTMRAGTLQLNNSSFSVAGLIGTAGTIGNYGTTTASTLTLGGDNNSYIYNSSLINGSTAALAITKTGMGTQTFIGSSITYSGATTINNGAIALQDTISFASPITFGTSNSPKLQLVTTASGDSFTFSQQINGGFSGATVEKTGAGTVFLTPAANSGYAGTLTVTAGNLYVNNSNFTTPPAVNVASNATLAGTGTVGAVTVASGGMLLGGQSNAGTLTAASMTFSGTGSLSGALAAGVTPFVVTGAATATGANSVILNITGTLPANGTYHFLQYGSLGGTGFTAFNFSSPTRSLAVQNSAPYINIVVQVGAYPIWTGVNSTAGVANFVGSNNWVLNTNGSTTDFLNLDNVLFDDTATGSTTVNIASIVNPATTTFNNSALAYTLQGSGSITGGTLTMNGTGTVTISNANTYTGGTVINGGTLNINNASAIGSGTLTINGGTIDNTSAGPITLSTGNTQIWAADFTFTGTQSLNMGSGGVTITANRSITVSANTLSVGGIAGTGFSLDKEGAGTLVLQGPSTYTGATTINGGMLQLGTGASNVGYVAAGYTIGVGATLRTYIANTTSANAIPTWSTITGGGTLSLNSSQPVNGTADWGYLSLPTAFTGNLIVENGRVDISSTASLGSTSFIQINSGAQILFFGGTYTQAITVAGTGWGENSYPGTIRTAAGYSTTYAGPITLAADSSFLAQAGGGTLTLTGSITGNFQANFNGQGTSYLYVTPSAFVQNSYGSSAFSGGGYVVAGNQYAFSTGGFNMLQPDIVFLNGSNFTFANLTGAAGTIENGSTTSMVMTVGDNSSTTYGGSLANGYIFPIPATNPTPAASFGLTKVGNGTLTLTGVNTYTGVTTLAGGELSVSVIGNGGSTSGNLGSATNDPGNLVFMGGALQYTGVTASTDRGFTIAIGSSATFDITTNSLTMTGASPYSDGGITKIGAGTLVLSGVTQYAGATTITAGKMYFNGTHSTSAVNVAAGTTVGGSGTLTSATVTVAAGGIVEAGYAGSGQLSAYALTYTGAGTLNIGTLSNYSSAPALLVTGYDGLTTMGNSSVTINVASLGAAAIGSTYKLIGYTDAIQGSGYAGFVLGTPLPSRALGTIANNSGGPGNYGEVDLTITATDYLKWTGAGNLSHGWDTTTQNWKLASNNSPTTYINNPGDSVVFDDSASSANTTVVIGGTANVTPSAVTFNNNTNNYTLAGAQGIGGTTSLIKNGTGSLTLANTNNFTGGMFVNAGSVFFNASQAFAGGLTVNGGSTTIITSQAFTGGTTLAGGTLVLSSPTAIGSGSLNLNGGSLILNDPASLGTGALTFNAGSIDNGTTAAMTLSTNNTQTWSGSFTFVGSKDLNLGTGAVSITAPATGGAVVTVAAGNLTVGGVISDTGNGFTKAGAGTMILGSAANTYTGVTTVNAGVLAFGTVAANGTVSSLGAGTDIVLNGGTLRYTGGNNGSDSNLAGQFNRTITINNPATIDVYGTATGYLFYMGSFAGSGNLNVLSTGGAVRQLIVTGNSPSYTGNIAIGNGTAGSGFLQYRSIASNPFGSGSITINAGGELASDSGAYVPNSLTNNLVFNGGTLASQGGTQATSVNYSGAVTVNAGTTSFLTPSSNVVNSATSDITLSGNITGSGNLTNNGGTNNVHLSGDNSGYTGTYTHAATGATTFDSNTAGSASATWVLNSTAGGAFAASVSGNVDLGSFSGSAGSFVEALNSASATFSIGALSGNTAYAGVIQDYQGTVAITKVGNGTFTLTGANTYSGGTTVMTGTLVVNGSLNSTSTVAVMDGGILSGTGSVGNATLAGNGVINLGSTGNVAGTLTVDGGNWNGLGTVAGTVNVNSGTFSIGSGANLNAPSGVTVNNDAIMTGSGTVTGSVNYASSSQSNFAGSIAGAGNTLTISGTGELILSGANTYTGATTVSSGTLTVNGSLASNAVSVNPGAFLGGMGAIAGTVTVAGNGQIRGDSGTGTGTLTVGSTTIQPAGILFANIGSPGVNSQLALGANTLNLSTNSMLRLTALASFNNISATYTLATLTNGSNLQLDGTGVSNGYIYGSFTQGTGDNGPVIIDMSVFGATLNPGDQLLLERSGSNLVLVYVSTTPEPALLLGLSAGILLLILRRKA